MNSGNITEWLDNIGLSQYAEIFEENKIDVDILPSLTEHDLKQIAIPLGDRKRMVKAIADLKTSPASLPSLVGDQPAPLAERSERRQLTLLFADLVGSTALSEQLDLEQYHAVLAKFLDVCASIVRGHSGFTAQYQGDCILAYFGFPNALEDDAEQAASAGLAIAEAVAQIRSEPGVSLQARVGIATGVVLVGDLLKDKVAGQSPVMGEAPNLASRLQAQAEPGTVVVNDSTKALLGRSFLCADLGKRRLKGFADPVQLWQVSGRQPVLSRFEGRRRGALTPFVNREQEMKLLNRSWQITKQGKGQVVLVVGEAGIGKSRITQALMDSVADELPMRLYYQCSPNLTRSALHPVIAQLEFAAGFITNDTPAQKLDKLEAIVNASREDEKPTFAVFARLLSIPADDRYGPLDLTAIQFKEAVLRNLLAQIKKLSERGPVVAVLEDIQWIDPTTAELLEAMIDWIATLPVMLICTSRPDHEAPWTNKANVAVMDLKRLDDRHAQDIVQSVSGGCRLPDRVTDTIFAKTDGIPLYVEELTKSVLESGSLRLDGQAYQLEGQLDTLALPSTLMGSLQARLDRVQDTHKVAPIGAAIGRVFSYDLLAAVTEADGDDLHSVLERLIDAGLVEPQSKGAEASFIFKHALIQDAAYSTLPRSQRTALHAKIAGILQTRFPEIAANRPEIVARHFTQANQTTQALECWRQAAVLATQNSAHVEAISHLQSALAQNQKIDDARTRASNEINLREMLCIPLEAKGWGAPEIVDNLSRLRQLVGKTGDQRKLFSVLHGSFGVHHIAGEMAAARRFARRMANIAKKEGDQVFLILSQRAIGMSHFFSGKLPLAIRHFSKVIELHKTQFEFTSYYVADPYVVSHCMLAWAYLLVGNDKKAKHWVKAAVALAADHDQVFSKIYAYCIIASFYQSKDDADLAQDFAYIASRLSKEYDNHYWRSWAEIVKGWALVARGRSDEGLSELINGIEEYSATGSKVILPYARTLLADAYYRAGRIGDGLRIIRCLKDTQSTNEVRFYDLRTERIASDLADAMS